MTKFFKTLALFVMLMVPAWSMADNQLSAEDQAHAFLIEVVANLDDKFPIDLGNGTQMIGVQFDDEEYTFTLYYYLTPESGINASVYRDYKGSPSIAEIFVDAFKKSPDFAPIINALKLGGYALVLNFSDWTEDDPVVFVTSPDDL